MTTLDTQRRTVPETQFQRLLPPPDEMERSPAEVTDQRLGWLLGVLSIALGVTNLAVPREVARFIGVRDDLQTQTALRVVGAREIAAGIGLFRQPKPSGWAWARVLGDAMDLTLLSNATPRRRGDWARNRAAALALLGITVLDLYSAVRLSRETIADVAQPQYIRVKKSITINRPVNEVYAFWHNFENLPRFMSHLEAVHVTGINRSHWKAKAPAGRSVEWNAEVTQDVPNERISWRSQDDADIPNSGTVEFRFAPGDRGTEVHVELYYQSPAGKVGVTLAKMFGEEPGIQVADDLRALKQVLETGEVLAADGAELGKRFAQRPAQPRKYESEGDR
jgi:uncharacterized membrane protein